MTGFDTTAPRLNSGYVDIDAIVHHSDAVIALLMRALNLVHVDGEVALDLVREASALVGSTAPAQRGTMSSSNRVAGGLSSWQVCSVAAYIDRNLGVALPIADLAKVTRLSESHFAAAFRTSFKRPPHAYILGRRLESARKKMLSTDAPLCQIALECGLADQSHLCLVFRRAYGMTPSKWRREIRQGNSTASLVALNSTIATRGFSSGCGGRYQDANE